MNEVPQDPEQMHQRLDQLGVKFAQRTRGELSSMREMLERARLGDPHAVAELAQMAHKIHGTGATFGFIGVSAGADRIERTIGRSASSIDAATADRIGDYIAEMERELERT